MMKDLKEDMSGDEMTKSYSSNSCSSTDDNEEIDTSLMTHFSCNLLHESKNHISFLRTMHQSGVTLQRPSTESLRRYSKLWLPLLHKINIERRAQQDNASIDDKDNDDGRQKLLLIPPPDIAWLWHCHRLAPYRYKKYIEEIFLTTNDTCNTTTQEEEDYLLDPDLPFSVQFDDEEGAYNPTIQNSNQQASCVYTQNVWNEMYTNDEPFFLNESNMTNTKSSFFKNKIMMMKNRRRKVNKQPYQKEDELKNELLGGFDILESCTRQNAFLWQVSGPKFMHDSFLREGVENYYKFVTLMGTTTTTTTTTTCGASV